ncbi:Uncharacterised protein [Mycobacteroides abscessus subsp. abscessus]|jgi:hypothetical protein|uniref:hypothetical protein n=1 Tax=Mycobacteroides abscessus TaxID=36809 RepID=UPI0009277028|nr:hypothetical protein [Mycobacteroides abscessus]SIH23014.1 Uncharacterised protein [Mycobacteroides abscessus subsp. abscessus]
MNETTKTPTSQLNQILALHNCDWGTDSEWGLGHCACGQTFSSERQWAEHADRAVAAKLWTPDAEQIGTVAGLESLPNGSAILARPGAEGRVCRRLYFDDPELMTWSDLHGTIRAACTLLPAVVLERGPQA